MTGKSWFWVVCLTACVLAVFSGYGVTEVARADSAGAFEGWLGTDGRLELLSPAEPVTVSDDPVFGTADDPYPITDPGEPVDGSTPADDGGDAFTLLAGDGKYVDRYVWSGLNSHGVIGFGVDDYPAAGGPWYSVGLGQTAGGVHLLSVGGKEYDGDLGEGRSPGVHVVYGVPGVKQGAVRIESAKFIGVSHLTHKSYCQGMRFALYGDGAKVAADRYVDGKLTVGETIEVKSPVPPPPAPLPVPRASTAQIWMWTMPKCGAKRVIPAGGDGVFGHVNELELHLVDTNRPTVTYGGDAVDTAKYWVNGKTPTGRLTITGSDIGSGVQNLALIGQKSQPLFVVRVGCDIYHRGASWNVGRPWSSQVCPNTYTRTQTVDFSGLPDGNTKLIGHTTDLAKNDAAPTVLDIWADHVSPRVNGSFDLSQAYPWNGFSWLSEKELRSITWKVHATDTRSGVSSVVVQAQNMQTVSQPWMNGLFKCKTPVPAGKKCEETVDNAFSLSGLIERPDGLYKLKVTATDAAGNTTDMPKTVVIAKDTTPPTPPKNLSFQANGISSGVLSWTPPVDKAVVYDQGKPVDGVGIDDFSYRIVVAGRPVTSWRSLDGSIPSTSLLRDTMLIKALPNDTDFEIQLRTRDYIGNSAPVQVVQAHIAPPTPKPVVVPPPKPPKDPCKQAGKKPKRCSHKKKHTPQKTRCKRSASGKKTCRKKKTKKKKLPLTPPELAACMVIPPTPAQQKAHAAVETRAAIKVANKVAAKRSTTVQATPSLFGKPKPSSKPLPPCTYNVFIRGVEISQGPAGQNFQGEQTQQKTLNAIVVDNTQNAVLTMFTLDKHTESRTVTDETTDKPKEIGVDVFTRKDTYSQAPFVIANRATIARVYVGGTGPLAVSPTPRAQVVLEGYRADVSGNQQKLGEIDSRLSVPPPPTTPINDLRTNTDTQASIPLPDSWVSAGPSLTLHAKVLPERALRECDGCTDGANEHWLGNIELKQPTPSRDANNEPSPDFPLMIYRITWPGNEEAPTGDNIKMSTNYLSALLPLAQTSVKPRIADKAIRLSATDTGKDGKPVVPGGVFHKNDQGKWLCDEVLKAFDAFTRSKVERPEGDESSPGWPEGKVDVPRLRYVGMFSPSVPIDCGGLAGIGSRTLISQAKAYSVLAHELGHNYGRYHAGSANGSDGAALGKPGQYGYEPWPDNDQGTINGLWFWRPSLVHFTTHSGDLRDLLVATPHTDASGHGDLMSYRNKTQDLAQDEPSSLPSPNTWNRITEALDQFTVCAPLQLDCQPPNQISNPVRDMFPQVQPPFPSYSHRPPKVHVLDRVRKSVDAPSVDADGTVFVEDPTQPRDRLIEASVMVRDDGVRVRSSGGEYLPMFDEIPQVGTNLVLSKPGLAENVRLYGVTERYFYRAFDGDGKLVAEREATINQPGWNYSVPSFDIYADVRFMLPASARKLQLVVREEDGKESVFAQRVASEHPPILRVVAPVTGERWRNDNTTTRTGGRAEVRWEIDDPDAGGVDMQVVAVQLYNEDGTEIPAVRESSVRGGFVDVSHVLPGEYNRVHFIYHDGWYTGSAYSPSFSVDPHPLQPKDVEVRQPGVLSDRFYGVEFFAQGYDPNVFAHAPIGDQGDGYKWYYKRKLLSTKQRFSTLQFRCSKESKLTFLLVVRGTFNQLIVRPVTTTLSPAKIPPELYKVCGVPKKKKHAHKRKKRRKHQKQ